MALERDLKPDIISEFLPILSQLDDPQETRLFLLGIGTGLIMRLIKEGAFSETPNYAELANWLMARTAEAHIACGGRNLNDFV